MLARWASALLLHAHAVSTAHGQVEYNRFVHTADLSFEPAPGDTGWTISGAVGFEAVEEFAGDLSCTVTLTVNGTVVPGTEGDHRIIVGPGDPTGPFTPANCAVFCASFCPPPGQCFPISPVHCACIIQGNDIPYGPGFLVRGVVEHLFPGDIVSISVLPSPLPGALPELDTSDDTAFIVVVPPPCAADWDESGAVTSADITAFLLDWFADLSAGTALADFDHSGGTTSAEITAFLAAWFAALQVGC